MPHGTIITCLCYMNDNENYITSWVLQPDCLYIAFCFTVDGFLVLFREFGL